MSIDFVAFSQVRLLRRKQPVEHGGLEILPVEHSVNPHQKGDFLTHLQVGDWVAVYVDGLVQIREIQEIEQRNFLPRFLVGVEEDVRKWVGKTKILGKVKRKKEEVTIEIG